jgi:ribosomal protein L37AE/L43A
MNEEIEHDCPDCKSKKMLKGDKRYDVVEKRERDTAVCLMCRRWIYVDA